MWKNILSESILVHILHMIRSYSDTIFISLYMFYILEGCPLASKITTCNPKCKDDTECFGKKCCSNICNTKSCVPDNLRNDGDGYKQSKCKYILVVGLYLK